MLFRSHQRRQYAERSAINAPMQGTAADIIKRAMLSVDRWLETERPAVRLIMQVHDELVLEVHPDAVESVESLARETMCAAANLDVALEVEVGVADNWADAH